MLSDIDIMQKTGGYINAIPSLDLVPGTAAAYAELLGRVQALPFVPSDWLQTITAATGDDHSRPWMPRYAIQADAWTAGKTSPLLDDVPAWLSTPEAATAWNKLTDWWKDKFQPILSGWARNQSELLQAANDDADFWNTLYTVVKPVAAVGDAILAAPEEAAGAVSKVITGSLGKLLPVIAIVVVVAVAVLIYKNKMKA